MFLVCHLAGDFLLQTDWQAKHKRGGLGRDPTSRRALVFHVASYTLAFVPALIWLWSDLGAGVVGLGALIAVPHFVQDDGRLVSGYIAVIKKALVREEELVYVAVDQSFHILVLFLTALLV